MQRGLFQGDALSPLLFCLCIAPLSHGLRKEKDLKVDILDEPLTHLFFMDDLKLYVADRCQMRRMVNLVDRASAAMGMMTLRLQKCAVVHVESGKVKKISDLVLPEDGVFGALHGDQSYRYLGVNQSLLTYENGLKWELKQKYLCRLKRIWESKLSGKIKINLTNSWAVSL